MANPSADAPCTDAHAIDLGFAEFSALQVVVLGIVQGITELLPISGTAHLRVIPGLLGWRDPGSAFSAAMQLASFAAVVTIFGQTSASSPEAASRRSPGATIDRKTCRQT